MGLSEEALRHRREYQKEYYRRNKHNPEFIAKKNASRKKYRDAHTEECCAYFKKWYADNRERFAAQTRQYRLADPERERKRHREWSKAHPDAKKAIQNRRRTRILGGGSYTADDVANLMSVQGGKCAGCKRNIRKHYTVDHVLPVSRGGSSNPDNLQLLCPICNSSKHALLPEQWAARIGKLFV